jgi:GTPase SAR1 family protein
MISTESGTPIIKVVFLGDPKAGKTTLLYTWCNIPAEKVGVHYAETVEPLTLSRVINQNCMIEYWDIGGNYFTKTPEEY